MFLMPGIQSTGASRVPSLMKVSSDTTNISLNISVATIYIVRMSIKFLISINSFYNEY